MQKARSSLQRSTTPAPTPQPKPSPTTARSRLRRTLPRVSLDAVKKRARFMPLLLLALACYAGVAWLITNIQPNQIQNWLLSMSYLPFHLLLGLGNFFLFTFLTLRKRWGIFAALGLQWLLFLKLQGFTLDLWAWGSAALIGAGGYALRSWWKTKK